MTPEEVQKTEKPALSLIWRLVTFSTFPLALFAWQKFWHAHDAALLAAVFIFALLFWSLLKTGFAWHRFYLENLFHTKTFFIRFLRPIFVFVVALVVALVLWGALIVELAFNENIWQFIGINVAVVFVFYLLFYWFFGRNIVAPMVSVFAGRAAAIAAFIVTSAVFVYMSYEILPIPYDIVGGSFGETLAQARDEVRGASHAVPIFQVLAQIDAAIWYLIGFVARQPIPPIVKLLIWIVFFFKTSLIFYASGRGVLRATQL